MKDPLQRNTSLSSTLDPWSSVIKLRTETTKDSKPALFIEL